MQKSWVKEKEMISLFFVSINDKTHIFYEIQYNTKSTLQKRENKKKWIEFLTPTY